MFHLWDTSIWYVAYVIEGLVHTTPVLFHTVKGSKTDKKSSPCATFQVFWWCFAQTEASIYRKPSPVTIDLGKYANSIVTKGLFIRRLEYTAHKSLSFCVAQKSRSGLEGCRGGGTTAELLHFLTGFNRDGRLLYLYRTQTATCTDFMYLSCFNRD